MTHFGAKDRAACKIRPCGWLVGYQEFSKLVREAQLNPDWYVRVRFNQMAIDGTVFPADAATIDKPILIRDLLNGVDVQYDTPDISQYDRVIDATGKGIHLPPRHNSIVEITQVRCRSYGHTYPEGHVGTGSASYIIPLGDGTMHVGYGSLDTYADAMSEVKKLAGSSDVQCGCKGYLWMGGPTSVVTHNNVVGVGESIGLVDPLSGMGITPAMDSARALVYFWNDLHSYEIYILRKYHYMTNRAKVLRGETSLLNKAGLLASYREASNLMGLKVGVGALVSMMKTIGGPHKTAKGNGRRQYG